MARKKKKKEKENQRKGKKISSRRQQQLQAEKELEEGLAKLATIDEDGNDIAKRINKKSKYKRPSSSDSLDDKAKTAAAASTDFYREDRAELARLLNKGEKKHKRRCFLCDRVDTGVEVWQKSTEMGVVFCPGCARTTSLQTAMIKVTKAFNNGYRDGDYTAERFAEGGDFLLLPAKGRKKEELPEINFDVYQRNGVQQWETYWWQRKKRAGEANKRHQELAELGKSITQANSSITNYKDKNYYHNPVIPEGKQGIGVKFPKLMDKRRR